MLAVGRRPWIILPYSRHASLAYVQVRSRVIAAYNSPLVSGPSQPYPSLGLDSSTQEPSHAQSRWPHPLLERFPDTDTTVSPFPPLLRLFPDTKDDSDVVNRDKLHRAAFLLSIAIQRKDVSQVCTVYPEYASAASALLRGNAENNRLIAHSIEDFVSPCMDLFKPAPDGSTHEMYKRMQDDLGSIWTQGIDFARQNELAWDPYTSVTLLNKHGRMDIAVNLAVSLVKRHQQELSDLEAALSPEEPVTSASSPISYDFALWRQRLILILRRVMQSYAARDDYGGVSFVVDTVYGLLNRFPSDLVEELLTIHLDRQPMSKDDLEYCVRIALGVRGPWKNTLRALLLRAFLVFGWRELAAKEVKALLDADAYLGGVAHDSLIEAAVADKDATIGWRIAEKMIARSQLPRLRNIDALLSLDAGHPSSVAKIYAALNGPLLSRRVESALAVYRDEVQQRGHHVDLLVPIIDALCPEGKTTKHGLTLALDLFTELCDVYPVTENDIFLNTQLPSGSNHQSSRPGGITEWLMNTLLRAAVETGSFEHVDILLEDRARRNIPIRTSFLNEIMEAMICAAKGHAQAFKRVTKAAGLWGRQLIWNTLFFRFVHMSYADSVYPPVDLALQFEEWAKVAQSSWNHSSRLITLLNRYAILALASGPPTEPPKYIHRALSGCTDQVLERIRSLVNEDKRRAKTLWQDEKDRVATSKAHTSQVTIELMNAVMDAYNSSGQPLSAMKVFRDIFIGETYPPQLKPNAQTVQLAFQAISSLREAAAALDLWAQLKQQSALFERLARQCWQPYLRCLVDCHLPLAHSAMADCPTDSDISYELKAKYLRNAKMLLDFANEYGYYEDMVSDLKRFSPYMWALLMWRGPEAQKIPVQSDTYLRGADTVIVPNWPRTDISASGSSLAERHTALLKSVQRNRRMPGAVRQKEPPQTP